MPDITNPFFAELAKTMTQAADDRGYQLVLCITNGDRAKTDGYLTAMQALYAPFGIVAPSTRVDIDTLKRFGFGHRVVVIDRVEGDSSVPSVTVDNRRGIKLAFDHLRSLGHTRSATSPASRARTPPRTAWTRTGAVAEGDPIVLDSGADTEAGARAAAQFLAMTDPPTAIIAANDMIAFAVISALRPKGVRVPTDVSVIGFDGLALGARFNPALTTVRQPIADMGNIAIDLAEKKAADGSVDHVVLTPELLVRASTAGPRNDGAHRRRAAPAPRGPARRPRRVHRARPRGGRPVLRPGARGGGAVSLRPEDRTRSSCPRTSPCQRMRASRWPCCACRPNLNVELFEWSSSDRRTEPPRHSDAGGHHLCFVVDDVDEAIAVLQRNPGRASARRPQGGRRRQPPRGRQPMDLLPHPVGTADGDRRPIPRGRPATRWSVPPTGQRSTKTLPERTVTMRIAGHTLGTPEQTVPEALALFAAAGLDAAEVIYQDGYRSGLPLRDRRAAGGRLGGRAEDDGYADRRDDPVHHGDQRPRRGRVAGRGRRVPRRHRDRADRRAPTGSASTPGPGNRTTGTTRPTGTSCVAALRTLAPEASDAGVRLCVENHFGTMTQSAAETAAAGA